MIKKRRPVAVSFSNRDESWGFGSSLFNAGNIYFFGADVARLSHTPSLFASTNAGPRPL
jgi:hypothetical protein